MQRKKDPNAVLDGKNVHPMNVIDIPLDYIKVDVPTTNKAHGKMCGHVITLPKDVLESSLGHRYQEFVVKGELDLISAHHKYLLLSGAGAYTDTHEDMSGSNVFYALLAGEKIFHVWNRTEEITEAIRTMTPELFDEFIKNHEYQVVHIKAGECMVMPGNLVHRVWTEKDSVAIGFNYISEPNMMNALKTRMWERWTIDNESQLEAGMRQLKETNMFYNFEFIAAIHIFELLKELRLNILPSGEQAAIEKLKEIIARFKELKVVYDRSAERDRSFRSIMSTIEKQWTRPSPTSHKFNWTTVEKFYNTGSLN